MVQARPIPGYLPAPEDSVLPNGSHEEINLEARRRHRQEKLPPLSPSDLDQENQSEEGQAENKDDAERILTIEEATNADEIEQKPSRGQKISNFFKNLGEYFGWSGGAEA